MYIIKTQQGFDSAHFLAGYEGKCANIHGHRWEVHAEVASQELLRGGQNDGMVVDFSDIKSVLRGLVDSLDHALLIQKGSMRSKTLGCLVEDGFRVIELDFRPTAENFARYFFDKIKETGFAVKRVTVYETQRNCATYEE